MLLPLTPWRRLIVIGDENCAECVALVLPQPERAFRVSRDLIRVWRMSDSRDEDEEAENYDDDYTLILDRRESQRRTNEVGDGSGNSAEKRRFTRSDTQAISTMPRLTFDGVYAYGDKFARVPSDAQILTFVRSRARVASNSDHDDGDGDGDNNDNDDDDSRFTALSNLQSYHLVVPFAVDTFGDIITMYGVYASTRDINAECRVLERRIEAARNLDVKNAIPDDDDDDDDDKMRDACTSNGNCPADPGTDAYALVTTSVTAAAAATTAAPQPTTVVLNALFGDWFRNRDTRHRRRLLALYITRLIELCRLYGFRWTCNAYDRANVEMCLFDGEHRSSESSPPLQYFDVARNCVSRRAK